MNPNVCNFESAEERVSRLIANCDVFDYEGDDGIALYHLLFDLYVFAKARKVDFDEALMEVRRDYAGGTR